MIPETHKIEINEKNIRIHIGIHIFNALIVAFKKFLHNWVEHFFGSERFNIKIHNYSVSTYIYIVVHN